MGDGTPGMAVRRSQLAGQRAAVVMNLVQSAKLHGHDPWACLNDVLTRLPTHLNSRIDELLRTTAPGLLTEPTTRAELGGAAV